MSLADCTVMVVEDHEFQRRTMLQILANLGVGGLLEAEDGAAALALLGGDPRPDVIVVDLDMPGMDGVEFLRHVADCSIDTGIVIASGLDDDVLRAAETTARAHGLTVLGAIGKPLTARRLLEVVGLHRPGGSRGTPAVDASAPAPLWSRALRDGDVTVALVPRTDLRTGRPAGLQARAWRVDDDYGAVDAAAELTEPGARSVAVEVAELVLDVACEALLEVQRPGATVDATIIIPPAACEDLALAERLLARAHAGGIDPRRLCVALARRPEPPLNAARLEVLTRLRVRGFGLGLDGFTAGDTTIGGPGGLPLTEVVLSREAIRGTVGDGAERRVAALDATISALRERGVRVVADGCDTAAERDLVAQLGADRAQGRAVGPVLAIDRVAAWAGTAPG